MEPEHISLGDFKNKKGLRASLRKIHKSHQGKKWEFIIPMKEMKAIQKAVSQMAFVKNRFCPKGPQGTESIYIYGTTFHAYNNQ